jgi:hypothetical protein
VKEHHGKLFIQNLLLEARQRIKNSQICIDDYAYGYVHGFSYYSYVPRNRGGSKTNFAVEYL